MQTHNARLGFVLFIVYLFLYGGFVFLNAFAAVGLLVWGQAVLLGGLGGLTLGSGEWMMLGATLLWSAEVTRRTQVAVMP